MPYILNDCPNLAAIPSKSCDLVERHPYKVDVVGSIPAVPTKNLA